VRINTNIMALNAQNMLMRNQSGVESSIKRLSSGLRINGAADDASGLAISEKMRSQIRGLNQAKSNAYDGISMIQTAEGALQQTTDILQRMRELAIKSENKGVLTPTDQQAIKTEFDELIEEVDRIATSTTFNQKTLLDGSLEDADDAATFKVGADQGNLLELTIGNMGISDDGLKLNNLDVASDPAAALTAIDDAIKTVSAERAKLGAMQNRMEYAIENLSSTSENLSAAESRIRDVDMAEEMVKYTKNSILNQAAMAMLAQANKQPEQILSLIG